ncbi:MAG: hypothetical protein GWO39_08735 [Gammaproteobacteria bacterium]|nr:hypothetical protein [Gammaproteobacteria bacterium]NIT63853.1 hypothetical protein [Gammaproteobacteria bacterium]NIV20857.1 hypothetical protein [Gammaproteobacteria bacterium]NIY32433.1 hypothetical protein [Gammaproteobacteria bacterium]
MRTAAAAIPAGGTWLERQRPAHYTIQLGADEDRTVLQQRARALGLDKDYAIFRSERNGRALYALIYGAFTTPTQAGSAIDDMPDDWKRDNPWIRDFRGIRRAAGQSSR